jgi:predicted nucleic acid-binding protein
VAVYYLDTSAAVKRYAQEIGTGWVQALTDPKQGHLLFLVRITLAEIVAAITGKEKKSRTITPANAATALTDFQYDFARQYLVIEVSAALVGQAALLARKHALRGYDAVQLAAALEIRAIEPSLILVSADGDLNAAAIAEGLPVEDPTNHP